MGPSFIVNRHKHFPNIKIFNFSTVSTGKGSVFKMKVVAASRLALLFISYLTLTSSQFSEEDAKQFVDSLDTIFCDAGNAEMTAR